ncbi:hypothetical protein TI05_06645 [Achromatium sp. WMS3]|nr:hypothetical protein TI05_06645 [Achromatium sp. WMS3]
MQHDSLITLLIFLLLVGCASPQKQRVSRIRVIPRLAIDSAIMEDGYQLPLKIWLNPKKRLQAVIIALHGFNDYSNAFDGLGKALEKQGVLTYGIDQRGFGDSTQRGIWAGVERMTNDLTILTQLIKQRYPQIPLYLVGESMGAAVILAAPQAVIQSDGIVLIAPAVWSRDTMPWYQQLALWLGTHTLPWMTLTGSDGPTLHPSDNHEMLIAYSRDPKVIKSARIDALWGITNLMDQALLKLDQLTGPTLILYGKHDEIIPQKAFCTMLSRLSKNPQMRWVLYKDGWHMLTRDRQGQRVIEDITTWIKDPTHPLPSGEEQPNQIIDVICANFK